MSPPADAAAGLARADGLRVSDRPAALGLYATHQHGIEVTDAGRIHWICDQVAPTPPPALGALLERVVAGGGHELRRAALGAQATIAWHEGEGRRAEALWTQVLREPSETRDRVWVRACLNAARVMHQRRCLFESFVLTGTGKRAAIEAGLPYLAAFAASSRAHSLTYMGDLERAAQEIDEVGHLLSELTADGELRVMHYEYFGALAGLQERRDAFDEALATRERQLAALTRYGHVEDAVLAEVHTRCLALRFLTQPDARGEVIAELEALPERFALGTTWHLAWRQRLHDLRMRHALATGDHAGAKEAAQRFLGDLRDRGHGSLTMLRAARVGRVLAEELEEPELAREAFELASNACLQHVIEAERASREIPELGDATPQDWAILRAYRERMEVHQRGYLDAVAVGFGPGAPVFDHLADKAHVVACAWCSSLRGSDGAWIPIAHFLPRGPLPWVTHGICAPCRDRVLQGDLV